MMLTTWGDPRDYVKNSVSLPQKRSINVKARIFTKDVDKNAESRKRGDGGMPEGEIRLIEKNLENA